ncbi:peptidase M23 [Celeribacter arenosi]|uniref:Peptidase M23 n=1 Tax=Celeribacter arenosi TaxID=792649 RepID=A0ABP7KGJ6_9RHOB
MKQLTLSAAFTLTALPAFAHGGAHIHPHGMELTVAALSLVAVGVLIIVRRK